MKRALVLASVWLGLAGAAAPLLPLTPPPPDLGALVPFVAAPLDKPPVLADVPLPPAPLELPPLPLAAVAPPAADKPIAPVQPPRALPCIGAWTGVASESLECGRARFQRGEYDDAAKALERATRPEVDADILREARYWLAETYYRLDRVNEADTLFRQVAQQGRQDLGVWALHGAGWTALRLGDMARARDTFTTVLSGSVPTAIDAWARHGLGLASYALGRNEDAEQAWSLLLQRGAPPALARDALFWHGDALGRINEPGRAEADLRRFLDGGAHPLAATAQLRVAWWGLAAGHGPEALNAFRAYLALPAAAAGAEREWGEAGLALALLAGGDWRGARDTITALKTRASPLALPLQLRLLRAALDAPVGDELEPIVQDVLAANLTPAARGWVLIVKGEVDRAHGSRDDARTQFELARTVAAGTPLATQAAFRLARTNFELREFTQALGDLAALANEPLPADLHAAVLGLQGETAYQAGDYAAAGAAFHRALVEAPDAPETPMVRLAAAWTSLRQGRNDVARKEFLEFAQAAPDHASAADALELAAELTLAAGDYPAAGDLLERIVQTYPTHPRADFARINRAILLVRTGDVAAAKTALADWLARAPFPALTGRAHAALGAARLAAGEIDGAQKEFDLARREGLGAFASLGAGTIALTQKRWDDAKRPLEEARDAGTPDLVAAAEYGLAVARFAKGNARDFRKPAETALAALPPGPRAAERGGALLYVLTGIAVQDKDWPGALAYARRLATDYPANEAADDALERVAAGAAQAFAWPVAAEADALLRDRYPQSPFTAAARVRLAEGLLETGKVDAARQEVDRLVADSPNDPQVTLAQARVRDAGGDRAGALEAYARAARDGQTADWSAPALLGYARLLAQDKRWEQSRGLVERLLKSDEPAVVAEAAQLTGDAYAGEGDALAAAEYHLTATYVAPASAPGRRGLLAAARDFTALKQPDAAAAAYRKCLEVSDLPADVAAACRQGLAPAR